MSVAHIIIIGLFFFIGGLGMAAIQSALKVMFSNALVMFPSRAPRSGRHMGRLAKHEPIWK